ncbi:MAG: hypothetical protein K6A33_11465 [Clostridiales bacterium]|nr:hypothetical protein [Clostridiales bacterium]
MSDRTDRRPEDDDGRTVADMSGVEGRPSLFGGILGLRSSRRGRETEAGENRENGEKKVELTRGERGWYILGALNAALLIYLAFAVGLGLVILAMVLFW